MKPSWLKDIAPRRSVVVLKQKRIAKITVGRNPSVEENVTECLGRVYSMEGDISEALTVISSMEGSDRRRFGETKTEVNVKATLAAVLTKGATPIKISTEKAFS